MGSECVIRLITVARALVAELRVSELSARQVLPQSPSVTLRTRQVCASRAVFAQAERFVYLRDDVCGEDNSWWIHNVRATALQPHAAKVGRMSALTAHSTLRSPQCAVMHATYALYAAARVLC